MVIVTEKDCATVRLQKAVSLLKDGTELLKFMRAKPNSEPNRYTFKVDELFLSWKGKSNKWERNRILKARKGIASRPTCKKCFTISLLKYGEISLAADSKGVADMWVNGLQYLLWSYTRERAGLPVRSITCSSFSGASHNESQKDMEERAKRYRRVALTGNSGEIYRKIKVKTAATKKNEIDNASSSSTAKSPEEYRTLADIVHEIPFFNAMSVDIIELCIEKLAKEELAAGEVIINQGDIGDKLYLLERGEAEIIVETASESKVVHTAQPGSWFGEIALLFDMPRTATVQAKTDVKMWSLSREHFRIIGELSQDWAGLLNDVPELSLLTKTQLDDITSCMKVVEFNKGDELEPLGVIPQSMYIVVLGGVYATPESSVIFSGEESFSDSTVSQTFGPGDVICLEQTLKPRVTQRTYTVTEDGTSIIKIDRKYIMRYKNQLIQANNDFFKWKVLKKVPMLSNLVRQDAVELFDQFKTQTYLQGEYVIDQFSTGHDFFIINEGFVTIKKRPNPESSPSTAKHVVNLGIGKHFGELALLSGDVRSADVVVKSEHATFFILKRDGWESMMGTLSSALEAESNLKLLKAVPLLSNLNEDTLKAMSLVMMSVEFYPGDVVVREGDSEGSKMAFYIITSGEFEVTTNKRGVVAHLRVGDYFGERALLEATPRAATILCEKQGKCLVLSADQFDTHMQDVKNYLVMDIANSRKREEEEHNSQKVMEYNLNSIEIRQVLGEGAFGKVALGVHKITRTPCAVKSIIKERIINECRIRHLQDEVAILRKVHNPFVVQLYSTNMDSRLAYVVMEYLPGGEVFTLLQRKGSFSEDETKFYVSQVVSAFEYLHIRDIIYRDLKPENMVFDQHGYIKIVDFGFAKIVPRGYVTMTVCGTPDYVAPEIVIRKGHDRGVDIWAIGILTYEMMSGKAPFQADAQDPARIYSRILNTEPKFTSSSWKGAGWEVVDLIQRLLKKNPKDRLGKGKGGMQEIKQHSWFKSMDWARLYDRKIPAFHTVSIIDEFDVSNFEYVGDGNIELEVPECEDEQFAFLCEDWTRSSSRISTGRASSAAKAMSDSSENGNE